MLWFQVGWNMTKITWHHKIHKTHNRPTRLFHPRSSQWHPGSRPPPSARYHVPCHNAYLPSPVVVPPGDRVPSLARKNSRLAAGRELRWGGLLANGAGAKTGETRGVGVCKSKRRSQEIDVTVIEGLLLLQKIWKFDFQVQHGGQDPLAG